MADTYDDILNRSWDEIPAPKLLPDGDYLLKARGGKYNPAEGNRNARINFGYTVEDAIEIDDPDARAELGENYDFGENDIFHTVWVEKAKDWQGVAKHIRAHGIETEGMNVQDTLKAVRDALVIARIGTRSYVKKDTGEEVFENTASNFRAVE